MTTFEITITILAVLGLVSMVLILKGIEQVQSWQKSIWQELRSIRVNVADTAEYTHNHIAPDVEIISNNFLHLFDESKGLPAVQQDIKDLVEIEKQSFERNTVMYQRANQMYDAITPKIVNKED